MSGSDLFKRELLEIGAIERRRVKLRDPSDHLKLLTTSITKLKSIEEIVRLESSSQGPELRCVILTDFIRKAEMPKSTGEAAVCEDIGIVPIFEYLRRAALSDRCGSRASAATHQSDHFVGGPHIGEQTIHRPQFGVMGFAGNFGYGIADQDHPIIVLDAAAHRRGHANARRHARDDE